MKNRSKSIVVVGSINTDMTIKTEWLPRPGETILGGRFFTAQGGKGANQAVAAARLGAPVAMIAKVGKDALGDASITSLAHEGIDTSGIVPDDVNPSGVAMILIDAQGENVIAVASGSNMALTAAEVEVKKNLFETADIVLMQLEIPIPAIVAAAREAKRCGATVILNPAPAPKEPLPAELLALVDILIPNQTEAELICGVTVSDPQSAREAAGKIAAMGIGVVVITMGAQGVFTYEAATGRSEMITAQRVQAVDSTAAGDCFCGALAVALGRGDSLAEAVRFANRAAAISVTRRGAQPSLPYLKELQ